MVVRWKIQNAKCKVTVHMIEAIDRHQTGCGNRKQKGPQKGNMEVVGRCPSSVYTVPQYTIVTAMDHGYIRYTQQ